jgi:4-hydroxy-3-polyprenylbenzoate decarboxylase
MRNKMSNEGRHIVVAITGASGSRFGLRTVQALLDAGQRVSLMISPSGFKVLQYETGHDWTGSVEEMNKILRDNFQSENIEFFAYDDMFASVASGSSAPDAVVVVPCSMGTVGRIAAGLSNSLIERVADVALKERRKLVLVPRETPFSTIHLENLLRLSQAGAQILPAMPGYYQRPETLADLDDFIAGKILDSLHIDHQLFNRWGDGNQDEKL